MRDFASECITREIVKAAVLGATNAGTAAVDMNDCRNGQIVISLTVGTDVATACTIQHSVDNVTFVALQAVPNASLAASAFLTYDVANLFRYVRVIWTRAAAGADSYWSIVITGDRQVRV